MKSEAIFQRIKQVRVADTVVDQVISLIEDNVLKPGDKLPSERELVAQFQVARPSIREALRILEFQQVIQVRHGRGAFVLGLNNGLASDEERVRSWFHEHGREMLDVLEVRTNLEGLAARLAAEKATPEAVAEIQLKILAAEKEFTESNWDELVRLDRQFHLAVARSSGNALIPPLTEMLIDAMVNPRRSLMRLRSHAPGSWADHTAVLDAIRAHDPQRAEQNMLIHLGHVRTNVIALSAGVADALEAA
ncbi:MAG: FadR family transcriptional regulator [Anaerolineales bacterium]|nr:FadR family transcriptional regulator [Anaerolineales bacterium]